MKIIFKKLKKIAKSENLKIYSVGFYQTWVDNNILPQPTEIFNWIANAKYIITDTFHGSIFSIRYHKQFATIVRKSNSNKLMDLLSRTEMESRIVVSPEKLGYILKREINYEKFEQRRQLEVESSVNYLKRNL